MDVGRVDLARNIPLFIAFRVLFSARFYYPVIGILFLDLGLSLEQYALLNVAWAVAIMTLEVPSGAMADVIGRRRMVVLAAVLMVIEMLLFAFAPSGQPGLLFTLLLLNRILGGAAEAAASGADEALAYDSLPVEGRGRSWPLVLERLMRWQSGSFFLVMVVGALLYDPTSMHRIAGWIGITSWRPSAVELVRWPVYLTIVPAVAALLVALALREPGASSGKSAPASREVLSLAWKNIRLGARCVVTDRRILLVLFAALACDSVTRLFATFETNYLRLIIIPEFLFGLIGAMLGLLGFVAAPLSRWMVDKRGAPANFAAVAALILIALAGAAFALPVWGVWIVVPLGLAMQMAVFFVSHYLNLWTLPATRATVLSFRGVALNLAYGTAGLLFAALTARLRATEPSNSENAIFAESLLWMPPAFVVMMALLGFAVLVSRRRCREEASRLPPAS